MNPYWGVDFFSFFSLLFTRLMQGEWLDPTSDEIQIGVLVAVAISCGLLGPFLVLKRMAMFANSLSHTLLVGLVASAVFFGGGELFDLSHLVFAALISAFVTALFTEGLVRVFRLQEEASVGLVFTLLFALGILLATVFTRDAHIGIESIMGNVDALQLSDLRTVASLSVVNGVVISLFFRHFQVASFDRNFAKIGGGVSVFFHFLLLFLVAATCIASFRAIGVLLVLAFLVGPYLTARLFCHRLQWLLFWSCCIGSIACVIGVALARHVLSVCNLSLSTGGVVVCVIGLIYVAAVLVQEILNKRLLKT